MPQTVIVILLSALSVFGMIFVLELAARFLLFGKDNTATIKIIRRQASELEYSVRAVENLLEYTLQPRGTVLFILYDDTDAELREIAERLSMEYGNIVLCEEQQLPKEIMRVAGLQTSG